MNFRSRDKQERLLPVDMTPMIDIVFQLLIFFLTTAQLAQFSRAEMEAVRVGVVDYSASTCMVP